jgi:hypothetical protein
MPLSPYYKRLSGDVRIPDANDPVDMSVSPGMTNYTFGADMANPGTYNQFLGAPDFEDIRQQFRPSQKIPPAPPMPQLETGYEPLEIDYASTTSQPYQIPQAEKPKPQQSYGTNRGGTGGAGRGVQLGKSQFDIGPQFSEPNTGLSIADLRMLDDKPWELDDNTKADVAPGTSLEPQKDNVTDKMPDLNTPQGLYSALAKKYPDILQQNLDQVQQARVAMEDVDALRDRGGLGSLFIAASKAASGAGSIGGKQAESIAEKIVTREDTLARQQLKDRLDVANENMQMNARAVDLAIKQINFADEREQYDPNSDVSQFARDFMRQEFKVNVPESVPAYQLKQFMPAVVQKYQAEERARYQAALLGYKETPQQEAKRRADELAAKQKFEADQAALDRRSREKIAGDRLNKPGAGAKVISGTDIPKDVADKEFSIADKFNNEPSVKKFKSGNIALQEMQGLSKEQTTYGDQGLISGYAKILDPDSVVREGEYAVVERGGGLLDNIANRIDILQGKARLQPAQRQALLQAAQALQNGRRSEYQRIRKTYEERARQYGLDPVRALGTDDMAAPAAGGGLSADKKKRLEELRSKLRGGQ